MHYYSWRLRHPSIRNEWVQLAENQGIVELNSTIYQLDIIDIYRLFHPTTGYTSFSNSHRTFTKVDHILDYKAHLSNFKRIGNI